MLRFGASIFTSAFLLFALEPLLGKALLPWFGGSPAAWTTCLVFFQVLLLAGYGWAHALQRLTPARQALLHALAMVVAAATLGWAAAQGRAPLLPDPAWRPTDSSNPTFGVLRILLAGAGAPTLCLAATSPLLQRWFSRQHPQASSFRLYAVSNAGSLLALLAYPFLIEPLAPLRLQAWLWLAGFGALTALVAACAWPLRSFRAVEPGPAPGGAAGPPRAWAAWLFFSGVPAIALLAVTNHLCQEIAPVSFLWVLPLALYLVTFILCFESDRFYARARFVPALGVLAVAAGVLLVVRVPVLLQVATFSALLFAGCMVCHGELARRRPAAAQLTRFYLWVAAGGALGGISVALVAPLVFETWFELDLTLLLFAAVVVALLRDGRERLTSRPGVARAAVNALVFCVAGILIAHALAVRVGSLTAARSFFGTVRVVKDQLGPGGAARVALLHGASLHGFQISADAWRDAPTAYFTEHSGVGRAIANHPRRRAGQPLSIGVVGLGIGTLAAYARADDRVRVYELSPEVARLARDPRYFTYLEAAGGRATVVLGDGRLALERELAESGSRGFDVLVLDAFSSNSVPVHLLTREAFATWAAHLRGPDSLLAFNVKNRTLDLAPLVMRLGEDSGFFSAHVVTAPPGGKEDPVELPADWVLLARSPEVLAGLGLEPDVVARPTRFPTAWTDDFSNLAALLKSPLEAR